MSFRRAAMRRDAKNKEKIQKCKAPGADILRARNDGWEQGKKLAICIIFECVYKEFGWRIERLRRLSESLTKYSLDYDRDVLRFSCSVWHEKLKNIIEKMHISNIVPTGTVTDMSLYTERCDTYLATASFILSAVYSEYSFTSNSKGTGRMDRVMNRFATEYARLSSCIDYDIITRCNHIEELIGLKF